MEQKKILIVDDSGSIRRIIEGALRTANFTNIFSATSGEEALELAKKEQFDLILLDVIMPNLSGMDVLRQIGAESKIIVISAVGQAPVIENAKKLGAIDYLVKPFTEEQLLKMIRHHLK